MARTSLYIEKLTAYFRDKKTFEVSDITAFYRQFEAEPNRATVDWRIHELKKLGVVQRIGRGVYTLEKGESYEPAIEKSMRTLYRKISVQFPFLKVSLWNTKWLNEFMVHQPGRFYLLVETERDAMEAVFFFLKEKNYEVFLDPSKEILNYYVLDQKEVIIVTRLVTEAPLQTIDGVQTATLEKILVDIFCDEVLFAAHQGSELRNIYDNAFQTYLIDRSRMLRYASRRKRKEEIEGFCEKNQRNGTNK
ncbi:MAG: hypothetical protein IPJ40_20780 [Saprospirales bacterium]|nr:hypothetical protein [Saprospirales bacterium]